jgi:hypothetical protein
MPLSEFTIALNEVIESNLTNPTDTLVCVNAGGQNSGEPHFFRVETKFKPMFVTQIWHKLYGGALMETDPVRLSLFLVLAEEAILDRYIELIADVTQADEIVDLQSAVAMLSQLREAIPIGYVPSQFVA